MVETLNTLKSRLSLNAETDCPPSGTWCVIQYAPFLYQCLLLGVGFESHAHFYTWCVAHSHGQIVFHGVNVIQLTHPFMD